MRFFALCLVVLGLSPLASAAPGLPNQADCIENAFAAPDDDSDRYPLTRPDPLFAATLKAANEGNAVEQRSLAVSYQTGFLVSPCAAKAHYWYRMAAEGGDEIAKAWVARRDRFDRFMAGPECMETSCSSATDKLPQVLSLTSDPRGHFFANLTINGVTLRGMIDTGASTLALDVKAAQAFHLPIAGTPGKAMTANGMINTLNTIVPRVQVGPISLDNVGVSIGTNTGHILIGMTVLRQLKVTTSGDQMILAK